MREKKKDEAEKTVIAEKTEEVESGKASEKAMTEVERPHVVVSEARLVERSDLLEHMKK